MKRYVLTLTVVLSAWLNALSQGGIPSMVQGLHGEAISLSGNVETYGELYSISGRESRRPPSTARLYFHPTLSFYDAMTVSFNFLLSTEGSSRSLQHQVNQINQLGIRPQWEWGYANAGDFTETFTPYTLNGILIRGGGVAINPGLFRFSALGGLTRRTGAQEGSGSFDLYLYGAKIGIGDNESFFDIMFVRIRDTPSKFQIVQPDSIPPPDSTQVGTTINPSQETPQENLVLGIATSFKMLEDVIDFHAEASGSAFTRDMNSSQINEEKIPPAIKGLYSPRLSTSADYAYNLNMGFNFSHVKFKVGYRYIGPGYNSMGVASLITDQREILFGTGIRLSDWSMTFNWTRQNDNLLDQKLNTTIRQTFSGNVSLRPVDSWSMGFLGNVLTLRNHATNDAAALIRFLTFNVGTTHAIMIARDGLVQSTSLSFMFQKSADENPLRRGNRSMSNTITANATMNPFENFTVVPSISIVTSRVGAQPWATIETYSATPQYRAMENNLVTSLTIGLARSQSTSSLQTNLAASYRITQSNTLTLSIRRTGFQSDPQLGSDYSEHTASLTISQRL
jgi:hypothetical protein